MPPGFDKLGAGVWTAHRVRGFIFRASIGIVPVERIEICYRVDQGVVIIKVTIPAMEIPYPPNDNTALRDL